LSTEENFFYDELTVKENLIFYAELKGLASIPKKINTLLENFDLFDFRDKKYYKISFGSKRKLSIACAFLGSNDLVLLDEPLMGIDIKAKAEILTIIRRIKDANSKMALIISTSDPDLELIELANRVWWMARGELVLNERTDAIEEGRYFYFLRLYPLQE
jgi:ABC-type multidrug transport system ATPase subunit